MNKFTIILFWLEQIQDSIVSCNIFGRFRKTKMLIYYFIVYIELGSSTTATANLKFEFDKANNDRNWDIKVSQFTCYDRNT